MDKLMLLKLLMIIQAVLAIFVLVSDIINVSLERSESAQNITALLTFGAITMLAEVKYILNIFKGDLQDLLSGLPLYFGMTLYLFQLVYKILITGIPDSAVLLIFLITITTISLAIPMLMFAKVMAKINEEEQLNKER